MKTVEKELNELEEFIETAHGTMTIEVNGMIPHVTAKHINEQGALMATFGALHTYCIMHGGDFDEIVDILKNLNQVMKYQVAGNMPDGKAIIKEKGE